MELDLAAAGRVGRAQCLTDEGKLQEVDGLSVALSDALPHLAAVNAADIDRLPASVAAWSFAAKFALDLIARGRIIPALDAGKARWRVSLTMPDDAERFTKLANSFPLAAHAVPIAVAAISSERGKRSRRSKREKQDDSLRVWAPDALLEHFLHAAADSLARGDEAARTVRGARKGWESRLLQALSGQEATFAPEGFAERLLTDDLQAWIKPLAGAQRGEARACFRLDFPENDRPEAVSADHDLEDANRNRARPAFTLRFLLQAMNDPSLLVPAADVYRGRSSIARGIASSTRAAQEYLLTGLAAAGRLFPAVAASLHDPRPEQVALTPALAWDFLNNAAPQFIEAGLGVILPAELTRSGQRRLRMRMRLGGERKIASAAASTDGAGDLTLDSMLKFSWQAELGGEVLSEKDLRELAKLKAPLVQHRGRWVAVDAREIAEALRLLDMQGGTLAAHEGLAAALGDTDRIAQTTLPVDVGVEGAFAEVVTRLRTATDAVEFIPPSTFTGTLRPYQMRGLGWLITMAQLNLGACLADDMGLGKTVQLIALLLHRQRAGMQGPVLLVCPTSVVGNWERELQRFAPSLPFVRHYGALRARSGDAFADLSSGTIVLTTYGLLRRDVEALGQVRWSVAALDEAQNIKNASSRTAQAARTLQAEFRVALTGTPVENRLTELWSISEFLNPRLLGPQAEFRREFAIPIERYGQADAAERLKRIVQPFILRRLKSDPTIIQDLPSKQEMKVICSLTREQASLYQAALDEAMQRIETSEGIERRGQVLALLTALKQICNHPAQYLGESGPLRGRSGKLQRCIEMLDEVLAGGDRALVFTQYREMGDRLVSEINRVFGIDTPFLHGGVPRAARDAMVQRFQEDPRSPAIFVLSVKAGGTGLNLTAANHVFHFDRWWNPAVEDQATDRAYRIGQRRAVQVHKLLCAGTVEDKVDQLLERKRDLAARIVGAGEQWITELDDASLKDLFSLAPDTVIAPDAMDTTDLDERSDPRAAVAARKRRSVLS